MSHIKYTVLKLAMLPLLFAMIYFIAVPYFVLIVPFGNIFLLLPMLLAPPIFWGLLLVKLATKLGYLQVVG